jgi:hypothetical protein
MIRKTALLAGIAGLMLTAPAAFAQDTTATPAPAQAAPPAPAAQPGTLQLQPGSDVKGSDGTVLGKLEGVRKNDAGDQELTVRGTDGQLRGVPLAGLKQEGAGVSVAWTSAEYTAAPAIAADAATTAPTASPASESAPDAGTTDSTTPDAAPAPEESAQPQVS